ncbi:Glycosyltransferase family 1 protein [Rubrivivax sp. A210]|uniref:glycosyltransferase family 4 protein n=1 Tax=Rubrivivax sp. A210 TaxID=2772301 RepID=UPI00191AB192|nr:glycosyltransferase family 1 protein [Rubrivivax sp. A210]CAD5369184.1 Glycosyltransferase family 1 protein [Rubrivivax sp. A210]
MKLVLYTHPDFLGSQSMPRFARSLAQAYAARGHQVCLRTPRPRLRRCAEGGPLAKWAGYVDQYLIFPRDIRTGLRSDPADTLYVFCDQALGPWVPWVAHRPHVVHCHDLLALRSALGLIPENPTGPTGRVYQHYIRRGFRRARHFISVSARSRDDLHQYGGVTPVTSEVVYNGLNYPYAALPPAQAQAALAEAGLPAAPQGLLLHVSGAQWYKNVAGVLRLYARYAGQAVQPLPLWLVGVPRDAIAPALLTLARQCGEVHFLHGLDNATLNAAYAHARAFLFPSLAEGFGWPIVEAQACGCPVITTDEAPMNEIGGPAARYLPRLRAGDDAEAWAAQGARVLQDLLALPADERARLSATGVAWAARFDTDTAIERYLRIYAQVLAWEQGHGPGATFAKTA